VAGCGWPTRTGAPALHAAYADLRAEFQNRPEFMVNLMEIDGASPVLAEAIRVGLALNLPRSSFDIDLDARRAAGGNLRCRGTGRPAHPPGGVLQVDVHRTRARDGLARARWRSGCWTRAGTGSARSARGRCAATCR
jgi:cell division protein FtsQ